MQLDGKACESRSLLQSTKHVSFLPKKKIPTHLSVGSYLCFAAVQFDDLQSLQYLIQGCGIDIMFLEIGGWNLAHACAYYGRLEIAMFLIIQLRSPFLFAASCRRKPWEEVNCVHIAALRGHIMLADLLIEHGCPPSGEDGQSVVVHTQSSPYDFVREWGRKKEKPLKLEKDIRKLIKLLSSKTPAFEKVRKHISSTECMNVGTWTDSGHNTYKERGPLGSSYVVVLYECCMVSDRNFVLWLLHYLSFEEDAYPIQPWRINYDFWERSFPIATEKLDNGYLLDFSKSIGDEEIERWLNEPWTKDVTCHDPTTIIPMFVMCLKPMLPNSGIFAQARDKILTVDILRTLYNVCKREILDRFKRGCSQEEIIETITIMNDVVTKLATEEAKETSFYYDEHCVVFSDKCINIEAKMLTYENPPLQRLMGWPFKQRIETQALYLVLAVQGYDNLILWLLTHGRPWDGLKEREITRIASFFGHSDIVDMFIASDSTFSFESTPNDRLQSSILGAVEAGRLNDITEHLKGNMFVDDPVLTNFDKNKKILKGSILKGNGETDAQSGCLQSLVDNSLVFVSVYAFLQGSDTAHVDILRQLLRSGQYVIENILQAAELVLTSPFGYDLSNWEKLPELLDFLSGHAEFDVCKCNAILDRINQELPSLCLIIEKHLDQEKELDRRQTFARLWLGDICVRRLGMDIQSLDEQKIWISELKPCFARLKEEQREIWARFELLKGDYKLSEVKNKVDAGVFDLNARDRGGLHPAHVAAAHDRIDILEWLVVEKNMDVNAVDMKGRTVLEIAKASNASSAIKWISERRAKTVISSFVASHLKRRLAIRRKEKMFYYVTKLQGVFRGYLIRRSEQQHPNKLERIDNN